MKVSKVIPFGGLLRSSIECNDVLAMAAGYGPQPWKPLRMREHNTFLSHAHVDQRAVANLFDWLENKAGLTVWYDAAKMGAGEQFASALVRGIGDSQSMLPAVGAIPATSLC